MLKEYRLKDINFGPSHKEDVECFFAHVEQLLTPVRLSVYHELYSCEVRYLNLVTLNRLIGLKRQADLLVSEISKLKWAYEFNNLMSFIRAAIEYKNTADTKLSLLRDLIKKMFSTQKDISNVIQYTEIQALFDQKVKDSQLGEFESTDPEVVFLELVIQWYKNKVSDQSDCLDLVKINDYNKNLFRSIAKIIFRRYINNTYQLHTNNGLHIERKKLHHTDWLCERMKITKDEYLFFEASIEPIAEDICECQAFRYPENSKWLFMAKTKKIVMPHKVNLFIFEKSAYLTVYVAMFKDKNPKYKSLEKRR